MRLAPKLALVCTLLAVSGCRKTYVVPETPMPPNTILLSQMMRQLSAQPGFTDKLLDQIDKGGKIGPALLTPAISRARTRTSNKPQPFTPVHQRPKPRPSSISTLARTRSTRPRPSPSTSPLRSPASPPKASSQTSAPA